MSQMKCRVLFGPANIGDIINETRKAIQTITLVESRLSSVYGFGSAFRGEEFQDIDILAVLGKKNGSMIETYYALREVLVSATRMYGAPMHLTVLTEPEFESRPLKCMKELVPLWANES